MKESKILKEEIYQYILNKIESGEYELNQKLPSERTIQYHFHVARETVRAALKKLEEQKIIYPLKSKGYYVSPFWKFNRIISISNKYNIKKVDIDFTTIPINTELVSAFDLAKFIENMNFISYIKKFYNQDDQLIRYHISYLSEDITKQLTDSEKEIIKFSLMRYLDKKKVNISVSYSQTKLTPINEYDKEHMPVLGPHNFIICKYNMLLDNNRNIIELSEQRINPMYWKEESIKVK